MGGTSLTERLRGTLQVFERPGVPKTTPEVAESLDLGRRAAYGRLERLVERDRLETKKVGANARVWWREVPSDATDAPNLSAVGDSLATDVLDDVAVGVFVLDSEFEVAWINETAERYFGVDREAVVGRDQREVIETEVDPIVADSGSFTETVLATYEDDTATERVECRVEAGDDREMRWLEHRSRPIETGEYAGGRVEFYYDVTDRKQAAQERLEEQVEFESLVNAVEEYAIFTLDSAGYVQSWNPGARQIKGYDAADIVGDHFSTFYTEDARAENVPEQNLSAARERGSIETEGWRVREDGSRFWANVTITAIRADDGTVAGYAKVTRDMTDRLERERRLREEKAFVDSILDNQRDIVYAFDTEGSFLRWNDQFQDVTGYTDAEIETMMPTEFIAADDADRVARAIELVLSGESVTVEATLETATGEEIPYEFTGAPLRDETGEVSGVTGIGRDVSERRAKARQLERRRELLERELDDVFTRIDDGFLSLDTEWRFSYVNEQAASLLNRPPEELKGTRVWDAFPGALGTTFEQKYKRARETQESVSFVEYYEPLETWFEVNVYPSESGLSVYFKDVTDRKERERELQRLEHVVETIADGIYVLDSEQQFLLVNDGFTSLTGYDRETLRGQHAEATFGQKFLDVEREKRAELEAGDSDVAVLEEELYTADGRSVTVESRFKLIEFENGATGRVGVVRDVTERVTRERELERQREQLEALNSLNEAVREISEAVIEQSSRREIEATVCERLAASDSYLFAWIGDVDPVTETVSLRTEAGVEGYLDGVTISVDPDDERSQGPTGRALRTGTFQVTRDVQADSQYAPWHDHAEQHDVRSSAALPIVHEGTTFGVLNVYTARDNAFEGSEREVIDGLGDVVGHAIAAQNRKEALLSDELVELKFQIRDVFEQLDAPTETCGRITLDEIVPVDEGEFLVYGTATPDAVETLTALPDVLPHWNDVAVHSEGDPVDFELSLTDPPVLSAVTSLGGYVEQAVIDEGDYRMTICLAPGVDVRHVIDTVEETYPSSSMLSHRQITRSPDEFQALQERVTSRLTERQRTAVEVAYHSGFFEWPRAVTGEDVADSLDVAAPTFHQHLRKGQRKVFDAVFARSVDHTE